MWCLVLYPTKLMKIMCEQRITNCLTKSGCPPIEEIKGSVCNVCERLEVGKPSANRDSEIIRQNR